MTPILDPRNGDIEDDASSTKRRSMLSLAGSLLAEISLPKLAIAWMLLIGFPGLLLGAAPLLVSIWIASVWSHAANIFTKSCRRCCCRRSWRLAGSGAGHSAACRKQLLVAERVGCSTRLYRVSRRLPASCRTTARVADQRGPTRLRSRRRRGGIGPRDLRAWRSASSSWRGPLRDGSAAWRI